MEGPKGLLDYSAKMEHNIGRSLTDVEVRALWMTASQEAHPSSEYYDSVVGRAHYAIIEEMHAKGTPLTPDNIKAILMLHGFEESMGRPVPGGVLFDGDHDLSTNTVPHQPRASLPKPPLVEKVVTATPPGRGIMQSVSEFKASAGRELSPNELLVVRELKIFELNSGASGHDLTHNAGEVLKSAMRDKGAPLSSTEMKNILKNYSLEKEIPVIPDGELPPPPVPENHPSRTLKYPFDKPLSSTDKVLPSVLPDAHEGIINASALTPRIPTMEGPVNLTIAEKWADVAESGPFGNNSHWESVRGTTIADLINKTAGAPKPLLLSAATLEAAEWQMKELIAKSQAMGFRYADGETGGHFLERVADELARPLSGEQIVERSRNIWEFVSRGITVRGHLGHEFTAERIIHENIHPGMNSASAGQEFIQAKSILQRVYANTGVPPTSGEGIRAYAERAIHTTLEKNPTLHANELLSTHKSAVPSGAVHQMPRPVTPERGAWAREA